MVTTTRSRSGRYPVSFYHRVIDATALPKPCASLEDFFAVISTSEPPPIPSNAANLTPWTKSNFLAAHLPGEPGEGNR